MCLIQASVLVACLFIATPAVSLAADTKSDIEKAYAAFDAAFDKGDAKAVAALYLPNAKVSFGLQY